MCVSGKVKCLASGISGFTLNTEYDIVQLTASGPETSVAAIVLNDNNTLATTRSLPGEYFSVVSLNYTKKVV